MGQDEEPESQCLMAYDKVQPRALRWVKLMGREGEHSQNVGWTRLPTLFQAPYFGNAPHPGVLPYTKIRKHEMWNVTNHPDKATYYLVDRHWHQASQVVSFVSFFGDPRDR